MMAFTHLLLSLAVTAVVSPLVGEHVAFPLVLGAVVLGGLAPDLDLLARHRRTLHYPVGYLVLTLACLGASWATGDGAVLIGALLFGAAALHVFGDLLGGSAEAAPWDPVTEFGVYNHLLGRWHRPCRLFRYSGSPGDLLLAWAFAAVALTASGDPALGIVVVALAGLAGVYTLARRRLGLLAAGLGRLVPPQARRLVPTLTVEESEGGGTTLAIRLGRRTE
jgi:hypothetical protein